jgi:RNA polymerase sigma-70 factor (ECF subfamily)
MIEMALGDVLGEVGLGNREAFAELYRRASPRLFGLCLRMLDTRHEAEECLQDVFLTVWHKAGQFDAARGSAMAWLGTIARNRALDRLRRRRGVADDPIELGEDIADSAPLAEAVVIADDEAQRVHHCLGTLDPGDQRLIRTAFFDGASYADLATRTARPVGTIKSRIRRALIRLKECLA